MAKRNYTAAFQNFANQKESIQNSYLRLACEIEPKIVESLPLESYIHLTQNHPNAKTYGIGNKILHHNLLRFFYQNKTTSKELLSILPNADRKTIVKDFSIFKDQLLDWSKDFCFEKRWIVKSAFSTLGYHRKIFIEGGKPLKVLITSVGAGIGAVFGGDIYSNADIAIQEVLNIYSENWTDFENRVKQRMRELKRKYWKMANKYTFKTKDFDRQKLRWLVWWNIKKQWTAYDIAINDSENLIQNSEKRDKTIKQIYNTIEDFRNGKSKVFDLPVRDKHFVSNVLKEV